MYFNLACAFAQQSDAPNAVEALVAAIVLDKTCREGAKTDTDFDSIRNVPAFRKLVYGE